MEIGHHEARPRLSAGEAFQRMAAIEQVAMQMGANDVEPAAFAAIRQQLRDGSISPEQAVSLSQEVLDSKQDYH